MNIRRGQSSDIPAIASLLVRSWRELYSDFLPAEFLQAMTPEHQIRRHTRIMSSGAVYFVADSDAGLAGFASYGPPRFASITAETELYTLYVEPGRLRQGLGSRLLTSVLEDTRTQYRNIGVLVMKKNPFRGFYEKNGFQAIAEATMDLGGFTEINTVYQRNTLPTAAVP